VIALAVAAVVLLVIAFATDGTVKVIAFNGSLLCLLLLIVLGVVALVRGRQHRPR
jgi:hypothetical protein